MRCSSTSAAPADAPLGAVYPPPPRPLFPLAMGSGFLPVATLSAYGTDWAMLQALAARHDWRIPTRWQRELQLPGLALVLTDAAQQICWVNAGFTVMSGYTAAAVLGRRPSFLQGPDTPARTRGAIRQCLEQQRSFRGALLNYRQNGQPYHCYVRIRPVRNSAGVLTHFLAFENEIPDPE